MEDFIRQELGLGNTTLLINDTYNSGLAWLIDRETNIVWHNGGTSSFNSSLEFDNTMKENRKEDFLYDPL
jgi:hypothetical protein